MTRANINYIYHDGDEWKILFFYWNGDQYPVGIRDYFHILDFIKGNFSASEFKQWAKDNYKNVTIKEVDQPKIYYTGGFITDYSYVFDEAGDRVLVFQWSNCIFEGSKERFEDWIAEQEL